MSLQGYNYYNYPYGFRNNEFHHVVLSISGTSHTLYLDGSMVSQIVSSGNMFDSYQQITKTVIGAQPDLAQAFRGIIGDVRVYNYAISSTKVSNLYRDRNLIVYYPFDTTTNSFAPNYATLQYDASMIGGVTTNSSSGVNALSLTNTNSAANQYVIGSPPSWILNITNGLTISCWVNVTGIENQIQRIFDIPWAVGTQGLVIDISGTNMLYSGWNQPSYLQLLGATDYFPFTTDYENKIVGGTISALPSNSSYITFQNLEGKVCANFNSNGYIYSNDINYLDFVNQPLVSFCFWCYTPIHPDIKYRELDQYRIQL
jgi:hypothetical protein